MRQPGDRMAAATGVLLADPSERSAIPPFIVMDVMRQAAAEAAAGRSVIHMEVGQPATPAPRASREAVIRAMERETLGYTLALGLPALRERIARHYLDWYGLHVAPERVVVTTGSSAGFVLTFLALFDIGARVGLPSPGYPCYRHILTALGCRPVTIETGPEGRWMPTADDIAMISTEERLQGLLIASPSNPTGTMLDSARLGELVGACERRNMWFLSDEIYHGLSYSGTCDTALAQSDNVIVINSFSKYFSMTGWRVGWLIVPEPLVRTFERLQQNLFIAPPTIAQVAALGAFDGLDELEANKRVYRANHDLLLAELPKAGLDRIVPADGAFYLYCDVSRFTNDSLAFAKAMLLETGVAATPGLDFDEARGARFLRFSYAGATERMAEAAHRLGRWQRLAELGAETGSRT